VFFKVLPLVTERPAATEISLFPQPCPVRILRTSGALPGLTPF